jgi:hypothetical protein
MIGLRIFAISMRSAILSILFILSKYSTNILAGVWGPRTRCPREKIFSYFINPIGLLYGLTAQAPKQ